MTAPRALPAAVWETAELDDDCPLVYRLDEDEKGTRIVGTPGGDRLRVAYDPRQICFNRARALLRLFVGDFRDEMPADPAEAAAQTVAALPPALLDDPDMARYAAFPCPGLNVTPDQVQAWEEIKRAILGAADPRAAAAQLNEAFRQVQAERAEEA